MKIYNFGALTTVVTTLIISFAVIMPTLAHANPYEISTGGYWGTPGQSLRADVMWGSTAPYQGVFLWSDNTSLSQEFVFLDSGNGYYQIMARHSGLCLMLDWRGGTNVNGTQILQYPCQDASYWPSQWAISWIWQPSPPCPTGGCFDTSAWYVRIVNHYTGRCLDANNPAGGLPPQQAVLQQWDCISSPSQWNHWNQMWTLRIPTSQNPQTRPAYNQFGEWW
jgi:hypothetical protein